MEARFEWISALAGIPARWDLRLLGWTLAANAPGQSCGALFDGRLRSRAGAWQDVPCPAATIAVGVDCEDERAAMLAAGFGEALPARVAIGELAVRLTRLEQPAGTLPRQRRIGPLLLDLLHRDARFEGSGRSSRWLALHPREFALLWRLADTPGERVSRERLLRDVWRLAHVPETNSLEVHVSRLRAKLAGFEAAWLVETDPRGGYRLARAPLEPRWTERAAFRTTAAV